MDLRILMFLFAAFHFGSADAFRQVRRNRAGKFIAGVPVHNYHLRSAALLEVADASSDWIVMLKPDVSQDQLESFCSNSGGLCTPEGHAGTIPFVELHGTEAELKELIEAHSSEVEFVEPDLATHLIPEFPSTQDTVTRYLPISVGGTNVLFHQGGSKWLVSDRELGGGYSGLSWRKSKDNNDRDDDYVPWGTVLENGVDEQDGWVRFEVKPTTSWGLDRVGVDNAAKKGKGVHVYVLDTGVRTTHSDFGGRAIPALEYVSNSPKECQGSTSCARDVHGHGTHCAGSVGGTKYGVAPESTIHGVKVLSDQGSGAMSWIVGAIDWVVTKGERPAVVSMSLGGSGRSSAYKTAIDTASNRGVTVVVAAGNENSDACNFSPAYVPSAITVGSTARGDSRSGFSNYGSCVQIYAPGSDIKSAGNRDDDGTATMSGTSMACPHVAGAAALLLESNPSMPSTQVLQTLLDNAVTGAITGLKSSCPNKLLYVGKDRPPTPDNDEGGVSASAVLPIEIEDCGGADHAAKIGDIEPRSVSTGATTMLTATGSLSEDIAGGTFNLVVKMTGFPWSTLGEIKGADICQKASTELRALGIWGGEIEWRGLDCPVSAGGVTAKLQATLSDSLPSGLMNAKVEIDAKSLDGKPLICANAALGR